MATYDLHQHLWPSPFIEALRARTSPPLLAGHELVTSEGRFEVDLAAHEPDARMDLLDRQEIDVAVLSLQPTLGLASLAEAERDALEELWAESASDLVRESGGRFAAFSPSRARPGFVGISLGASALLDLGRASAALDEAAGAGCVVFAHPEAGVSAASQPSWWEWVVGYPAQMQAAYVAWLASGRERWPTLRVVFAILAGGGPVQLERLAHRGIDVRSTLDENTYFDVATYGRRAIELLVETFGVHQLVYGSDTPVVDPRMTLDAVRGFGDAVRHVVQEHTPTALLS